MRGRPVRPQFARVRALVPEEPDVFGDAPVITQRRDAFRLRVEVHWLRGDRFAPSDGGKDRNLKAILQVRKRDVPPDVEWTPSVNDLVELVGGDTLFIVDVQPALPRRPSIRFPDGGWDGWRLELTDREPTMRRATQYE